VAVRWSRATYAGQADPRSLWKSVDSLLGSGRISASNLIDVETFNRFFAYKVSKVRSSTSGVPPKYSGIRPGVSFAAFSSVRVDYALALFGSYLTSRPPRIRC